MALGLNRFFLSDTQSFTKQNYLTTAGVFQVGDQVDAVDLRKVGEGQLKAVRIAPTTQAEIADDSPIPAYWVPQGGSCDIPVLATIASMCSRRIFPAARCWSTSSTTGPSASITSRAGAAICRPNTGTAAPRARSSPRP